MAIGVPAPAKARQSIPGDPLGTISHEYESSPVKWVLVLLASYELQSGRSKGLRFLQSPGRRAHKVFQIPVEGHDKLGCRRGLYFPLGHYDRRTPSHEECPRQAYNTFARADFPSGGLTCRKDREVSVEIQVHYLPGFQKAVFAGTRTG